MKAKKLTHNATGKKFWMHAKLSWGKPAYSADGMKTWHETKTKAFRAASENKTLDL